MKQLIDKYNRAALLSIDTLITALQNDATTDYTVFLKDFFGIRLIYKKNELGESELDKVIDLNDKAQFSFYKRLVAWLKTDSDNTPPTGSTPTTSENEYDNKRFDFSDIYDKNGDELKDYIKRVVAAVYIELTPQLTAVIDTIKKDIDSDKTAAEVENIIKGYLEVYFYNYFIFYEYTITEQPDTIP